jgi:hypothetical protein
MTAHDTIKINVKKRRNRLATQEAIDAKSDRMYFNHETHAAIIKYQSASIKKEKDKLYVDEIQPAFQKLVENLINIHKFVGLYDSYEDLKNDCINFLFETIHKFDASRGTNSFSYFNVVAKNWLIIKTKQKSAYGKKTVSMDHVECMTHNEISQLEEHNTVSHQDTVLNMFDDPHTTIKMLYEIRNTIKTENELSCINSIITIFENIESIDLLNKSAILLYMRELSGLTPKQLTTSLQAIKKHYKKVRVSYHE